MCELAAAKMEIDSEICRRPHSYSGPAIRSETGESRAACNKPVEEVRAHATSVCSGCARRKGLENM